jgi:hypothetical protein
VQPGEAHRGHARARGQERGVRAAADVISAEPPFVHVRRPPYTCSIVL